jgi:hypothetical protein
MRRKQGDLWGPTDGPVQVEWIMLPDLVYNLNVAQDRQAW